MSNACLILLNNGLSAVQANGNKFEISYCLPVYDPRTDATVRTNPVPNSESETSSATAPSDFNGVCYPKGASYVLQEWDSASSPSLVYESTSEWKTTPPFSIGSSAVKGLNGDCKVANGADVSGTTLTYQTTTTPTALASWDVSGLYKCVRYNGTKNSDLDGNLHSSYTIQIKARPSSASATTEGEFVSGSIRFNKVVLFQEQPVGRVPIAVVCLNSPVSVFGDAVGQINTISIEFQFGYDSSITPQDASFDNSYWSRITGTADLIPPVFFPGKLVIGENDPDKCEGGVNVVGNFKNPFRAEGYLRNRAESGISQALLCGDAVSDDRGNQMAHYSRIGSGAFFDISINHLEGQTLPDTVYSNASLVECICSDTEITIRDLGVYSSVVAGSYLKKHQVSESIIVGEYLTGKMSETDAEGAHVRVKNSLIVGSSNNLGFATYGTDRTNIEPDTSVIIGRDNNVYCKSTAGSANISSRTFILGNENTVTNGNVASDTFVFGCGNTVENKNNSAIKMVVGRNNEFIENTSNESPSAFVFGISNRISAGDSFKPKYVFGQGLQVDEDEIFVIGSRRRITTSSFPKLISIRDMGIRLDTLLKLPKVGTDSAGLGDICIAAEPVTISGGKYYPLYIRYSE